MFVNVTHKVLLEVPGIALEFVCSNRQQLSHSLTL